MAPSNTRKRQQQICFRSLVLPPSNVTEDATQIPTPDYCPHFLAALQLVAHTMLPIRKALVHFYISYRNKDVTKLEWLTLLAFGRLFRDLITANSSSGNSVLSGGSGSASANGSATASQSQNQTAEISDLQPVSSDRFFPILYTCLLKHNLSQKPKDVTEAIRVLIDCLKCCSRTLPVTNQLWSALLDKACLGLVASQTLVGRRKIESKEQTEVVQRSLTEQVILWCPHVLSMDDISRIPKVKSTPIQNDDSADVAVPKLDQLLEADFKKRPLATTSRSYYDFDKKSFDFEVQIPTKFLDPKEVNEDLNSNKDEAATNSKEVWKTTRSMQFASLTGYLLLGIDRKPQPNDNCNQNENDEPNTQTPKPKLDRRELAIPATIDLSKLCSKKKTNLPKEAVYELVGGALFDEGEYIAVLKDFAAVKASNNNSNNSNQDDDSEDEDETWKLMESEETIPMSESDVLEFLKGEGVLEDNDDDSDDEDDYGPVGTLAIYKLKTPCTGTCVFDEMDQLLSDIVISQVSGSLNSKTDYYIEEEYEEEIIED